jgi:hypothetical protein
MIEIEPVKHGRLCTATRAAMQHHRSWCIGFAKLRQVEAVTIASGKMLLIECAWWHIFLCSVQAKMASIKKHKSSVATAS